MRLALVALLGLAAYPATQASGTAERAASEAMRGRKPRHRRASPLVRTRPMMLKHTLHA
jgi:hypothetical protein